MQVKSVHDVLGTLGHACRTVALAVIAGICRRMGFHQIESRIVGLPVRDQAVITGAVLVGLFAASLFFAQFGVIGLALYLMAIVLLIG